MIPRINSLKSYTQDILNNLLKKTVGADPKWDYLAAIQKGAISREDRESQYAWIFSACDAFHT
jgi:hypothetical protein